jgi:glycine cleavage system aminomethyltransferase T
MEECVSELKKTVLYERHIAAGARFVGFGGWEMPVNYPAHEKKRLAV